MLKENEVRGADLEFEYFALPLERASAYNRAGVLYRAAQLERASGDLAAAQKHAAQAFALQADKGDFLLLKSELAFALRKTEKLDSALELLDNASSPQTHQDLTRLLTVNALVERDRIKRICCWTLPHKAPPSACSTLEGRSALSVWERERVEEELKMAESLLEEAYARSGLESIAFRAFSCWAGASVSVTALSPIWTGERFPLRFGEIKVTRWSINIWRSNLVEKARVTSNAAPQNCAPNAPP